MPNPRITPYLSFDGNCREALAFYHHCLGGELQPMTAADSPMAEQTPEALRQHVLHGVLTRDGQPLLMANDGNTFRSRHTPGNTVALFLNCASEAEIEASYAHLAAGGTAIVPLHEPFWGGRFGSLVDQFGIEWSLQHGGAGN